jgi:streptomycin 6-kinase
MSSADRPLDIPAVVRTTAASIGATRWLDELPSLVAGLERDWGIIVGATYPDSTEAFVAEADLADGTPAVLKVLLPRWEGAVHNEITVLRLASGEGCVRLLAADEARGAMLLERLGRNLSSLGLPIERRHEILCGAASALWRPAPDCGLPTGSTKGSWLIEFITGAWEAMGHPCTQAAIRYAVACARRRIAAHDDRTAVLVHGDVHQWNTLESGDTFKLVDPDGLLTDAEYDLGIIMREDPEELLTEDPRERAHRLAERTGRDPEAIWEWGAVERVSTGLLGLRDGLEEGGRLMLAVADRIAE